MIICTNKSDGRYYTKLFIVLYIIFGVLVLLHQPVICLKIQKIKVDQITILSSPSTRVSTTSTPKYHHHIPTSTTVATAPQRRRHHGPPLPSPPWRAAAASSSSSPQQPRNRLDHCVTTTATDLQSRAAAWSRSICRSVSPRFLVKEESMR